MLGAAPASAQPIEEELSRLLDTHPQIRAGVNTVTSAEETTTQAKAGFYPTVSARADFGAEYVDTPARRTTQENPFRGPRDIAGITVTQNLFNGRLTTAAAAGARINERVAGATLESAIQAVLFEGSSAYLNVLRQARLVQFARNSERQIQRQLKLEDEWVRRGSGITVDVLQAKSRLQIAKERRVQFEGALQDALSTYVRLFDQAPELAKMEIPQPLLDLLSPDVDAAIDIALDKNPQLIAVELQIDAADQARRGARAGFFPTIDLVGDANYERDKNATIGTRRDYSVLLKATWDLFSGFVTKGQVAQTAADYAVSQNNLALASRQVIETVKLAWQALVTARQRRGLLENAVNIAAEVFTSRRKLRNAGKETVINVLDAQNEVINAQINHTAAAFDARVAVYQLLFAMVLLTPGDLGVER